MNSTHLRTSSNSSHLKAGFIDSQLHPLLLQVTPKQAFSIHKDFIDPSFSVDP